MARSRCHAIPTGIIFILVVLICPPLAIFSENALIAAAVIFFGFFVDLDHLSIKRIRKILRGGKGPIENWVNWMHTVWALIVVVGISALLINYWPLVSYGIHILIDAGDRGHLEYPGLSPLPGFLHQFYPEFLKYETGLII